ncbi:MAG: VWA domain-containing protein [Bdellovibrionota bacterium]|nr:VWA domain-containing protein [Bdellovibrionota bacterium]
MNYLKIDLLFPILVVLAIYLLFYLREEKKKNQFIENTFFKKVTFKNKLRSLLFIISAILLGISLLDPRGPQEKLDSKIPDQKTIIVIDSSASMLAEDVRPNRFKKSLLMARHFIKKAYGHKVAVVLFSDTQKRLVPFTDDLDLLDARVAGLENLRLFDGGSNISQAIKESLGYFRLDQGKNKSLSGNLLVFTDSEGHDDSFTLDLPKDVSLAVVGVGTARGSKIPNRDQYGVFRGYKKFKGKEVITKLNEEWLKELKNKVETYDFWIANSYTIPTEDILTFFNNNFQQRLAKGKVTIRPVKVEVYLLPALVLLLISFLLYIPKSYSRMSVLLIFVLFGGQRPSIADEEITNLEEILKTEDVGVDAKLKLASLYMKEKKPELARVIYEEVDRKKLTAADLNNYALSLIGTKESALALKVLAQLQKDGRSGLVKIKDEEESYIRQNVLLALNQEKKQSKENNKDSKSEEKKKQKKQGEGEKNKEEKEGQENKDQGKEQKGDSDKKDKKESGKKKKDGDPKPSDQQDNNDKKEKSTPKPKSVKESQDEIRKKRKMIKVPAIIKQIMSDDRNLQQKYLDTSTQERSQNNKKDW